MKVLLFVVLAVCTNLSYGQKTKEYQSPMDRHHHLEADSIYSNDSLHFSFKVLKGWAIYAVRDLKMFTRTSSKYHPLFFGVENYKKQISFSFSDYNLLSEKCDNKRLVIRLRDTLNKLFAREIADTSFNVTTTQSIKKIGKYVYSIVELNWYEKVLHRGFKSCYYIRQTLNNHVIVGNLNMSDNLSGIIDIENGLSN